MIKIFSCHIITVLFVIQVNSQGIKYEIEPNNKENDANSIGYGDTVIASIIPEGDTDFFKFYVPNVDTTLIFAGTINNSELSATYQIFGNLISWGYYYDSIYVILDSGLCYLKFSSQSNFMFSKSDFNNVPAFELFPANKIKVKSNSRLINNNQIRKSLTSENNVVADTGQYRVILKKFKAGKPTLRPPEEEFPYFFGPYIFDELWNSVRFRIYFNPNGSNTTVKWEYGTDLNYGNVKVFPDIFTGIEEYCAISYLPNLIPNTTYHFRVHLNNSFGSSFSNDYSFRTANVPNDIEIIKPKIFVNFTDTSFFARSGGWYNRISEAHLKNIAFNDNLNGYIIGDPEIFLHTNNGGTTWIKKNSSVKSWFYGGGITFVDSLNGFLFALMIVYMFLAPVTEEVHGFKGVLLMPIISLVFSRMNDT